MSWRCRLRDHPTTPVQKIGHGRLIFRLTQELTDSSLGEYLNQIGRDPTSMCHSGAAMNSFFHIWEKCFTYNTQREFLTAAIGQHSLPTVITMLGSERSWMIVSSFCEEIFFQEEAEQIKRIVVPPFGQAWGRDFCPSRRRRLAAQCRSNWEEGVFL